MGALCSGGDGSIDPPPPNGSRRGNPLSRRDSLSDISDNEEVEKILERHRAPEEFSDDNSPMSPRYPSSSSGANNSNMGSRTNTSASGVPSHDSSNVSDTSLHSLNSSGIFSRSSGGLDLGKAREEAAIDLVDEFFVWDDMKYDLRSEINRQQNKHHMSVSRRGHHPVTGSGVAGMAGAKGASERNFVNTSGTTSVSKHKTPFVFNDFVFDDDDKVDEVFHFAAATTAVLAAGAFAAGSPKSDSGSSSPDGGSPRGSPMMGSAGEASEFGVFTSSPSAFNKSGGVGGGHSAHRRRSSIHFRTLGGSPEEMRHVSFDTLAGHTTRVKVLAVAPGEKEYVSCSSDDASLTYGDLTTGKELGAFIGHSDAVLHAVFSNCGKYLSSTSRDNTMILWDVVTQKALLTFEHAKVVICSAFSKDSKYVVTGCQDKVCRLWEARRGLERGTFTLHEGIIIAMAFSPDGAHVVSASSDRTLRKWTAVPPGQLASPVTTGPNKGTFPGVGKQKGVMQGHEGIILSCTFTSDGQYVVSNDERLVKIWKADTCQCYKTFQVDGTIKLRNLAPNKKLTWTLASAAPGQFPHHIVVAANNRFLYVLNIETGEEEISLYCKSPIYCLTSGTRCVTLGGDAFGNVYCMKIGNPFMQIGEAPMASRPATPALDTRSFS